MRSAYKHDRDPSLDVRKYERARDRDNWAQLHNDKPVLHQRYTAAGRREADMERNSAWVREVVKAINSEHDAFESFDQTRKHKRIIKDYES